MARSTIGYTDPLLESEQYITELCSKVLNHYPSDNSSFLSFKERYSRYAESRSPELLIELLEVNANDESYHWSEYFMIAQVQAFYKKRDSLPGVIVDRKKAALDSFLSAESQCRDTNRRIDLRDNPVLNGLLQSMQYKIGRALGPCPRIEDLDFGFGPGASVGVSKNTSPRFKLSADATTTVGAARIFSSIAHLFPHWHGLSKPVPVLGGKWTTVSKTWKTDRGIVVEPIINTFLQKGIGAYIRKRLKRIGIDIRDQSINQLCALIGSREGWLSTIDLKSASDTIARNLVREVLPYDWWCLLDACRSHYTCMPDGKYVFNEKFSSMGNGFTFELETLIFWAAITTVSDGIFSVYGDDIIVESAYFHDVIAALNTLGFTPNEGKSFSRGKFRESCGADYWDGNEVRPCFLKTDLSVRELFRLHNWAVRTGLLPSEWFLQYIPFNYRHITGPDGFGDGHLIDLEYKRSSDKRGWEVYCFESFQAMPRTVKVPCKSDFGAFLYLCGTSYSKFRNKETGTEFCLDDAVEFYKQSSLDSTLASESMYQERARNTRFKSRKLRVSG